MSGPFADTSVGTAPLGLVAEVTLGKMIQSRPVEGAELVPYIKAKNVRPAKVEVDSLGRMYATPAEREALGVQTGDIFVIEGGATAGRAAVVLDTPPEKCIFQNAVHRVRAGARMDQRFLYYVLAAYPQTGWYEAICSAATFKHLTGEKMARLQVPVPALEVQRRVADMLDAETVRIDTLIAKNQDLVRLNGIRRRTLVEQATKPRNGDRTVPLRFVLREVDERVGTVDTELPLLSVSISSGVGRRSTDSKGQVASDDLSNYKICRSGDIVLNRMRAFQGALGVADEDGVVSSDYAVLRPQGGLPRYFHHIMRAPWFVGEMTRRLRGIGDPTSANVRTPRINVTDLGLIEVPLPGKQEQHGVVAALDREFAIQERLTDAVGRQTAALKLKRQALITAAVTGQITV